MQQIKIFKSIESERDQLEREVNRWMRKSGARVISITGNISANSPVSQAMSSFSTNDILIIVLYEIDAPPA
jgi:hypothetical protein